MSYVDARVPVTSSYPQHTVPVKVCVTCGCVVHVAALHMHDEWHRPDYVGRLKLRAKDVAGFWRASVADALAARRGAS